VEAIEASRVRDDKCKMEQWGSESDFFKVTGSGVKRGFSGEVLRAFPFWERTGVGGGHRGSEVRIPALRFAIGGATRRGTPGLEMRQTLGLTKPLTRLSPPWRVRRLFPDRWRACPAVLQTPMARLLKEDSHGAPDGAHDLPGSPIRRARS